MIDDIPESGAGLFDTLDAAAARAVELQEQGRLTKVEESLFWQGWTVYAAPAPFEQEAT